VRYQRYQRRVCATSRGDIPNGFATDIIAQLRSEATRQALYTDSRQLLAEIIASLYTVSPMQRTNSC
jgi:hypothetical protein